jgi:7-cyano-7-deazaguanine synthase
MKKGSAVVLASGGLDSAALMGWALARYSTVQPLYCRFGLKWERAERHWLGRFLKAISTRGLRPLAELNLENSGLYAGHWSTSGKKVPGWESVDKAVYLPGRNALLLVQAGVYAARQKISDILIGTLKGNPFSDAAPPFFNSMEKSLRLALGKNLRILAPFRKMSKKEALARFQFLPLSLAFSCLNPIGMRPCNACNKCAERQHYESKRGSPS